MAKVLKTIGLIAGAIALVATGIGVIGVGGAAFLATAATVATVAGVVAGVSALGAYILTKPPNAQGQSNSLIIGSNVPSPYMMGESYSAGVLIHDTGYGATLQGVKNPYRFMAVVYSICGPVAALVSTNIDHIAASFSGTAATGYYNGFLYRDAQLGARPESDALAPQWAGAPNWGSGYKLSGYAAIGWSLLFDKAGKVYSGGVPALGGVWQGVAVYDPRHDSTYPGGSGSQRITDESTWTYSTNPALHALAYAYGRYTNGVKVFGVDLGDAAIDVSTAVAWANVCDANDWKVAGTIYEPGDKWNNLKKISECGAAVPCFKGGVLTWQFSAPKVPLDTITADDLADGDYSYQLMKAWKDRKNGIVPKYRSPAHQWDYVQSTLVQDSAALAEDGEEKTEERQFDLVTDADQAAQLAGYLVADMREAGPITLPCKPRLMEYRIGDVLTINIAQLKLNGVDCQIVGRSVDPETAIVTLTLVTETAAKHAFALAQTGTPPPTKTIVTGEDRDGVIGGNASPNGLLIQNSYVVGLTLTSADAGGTATIVISNHTRRYSDKDVAITGATLTGLVNATNYYIYYDDDTRAATAPTFYATTVAADSILSSSHPARHLVGQITTQGTGVGGDTSGDPGMSPGGIVP